MALAHIETLSTLTEGEPVGSAEHQAQPLDDQFTGAVAINGALSAQDMLATSQRLDELFGELRRDRTGEFGGVLTYAVGLSIEDTFTLSQFIISAAKRQNHGVLTEVEEVSQAHVAHVWRGRFKEQRVLLNCVDVPVPLSDGKMPLATVYNLYGQKASSKDGGW
jgi:hypothetical protein